MVTASGGIISDGPHTVLDHKISGTLSLFDCVADMDRITKALKTLSEKATSVSSRRAAKDIGSVSFLRK